MATTTKTATYKITTYRDGDVIGIVEMTAEQYRRYEAKAQWPEGIIRAGHVLSSDKITECGIAPDTTIYLD